MRNTAKITIEWSIFMGWKSRIDHFSSFYDKVVLVLVKIVNCYSARKRAYAWNSPVFSAQYDVRKRSIFRGITALLSGVHFFSSQNNECLGVFRLLGIYIMSYKLSAQRTSAGDSLVTSIIQRKLGPLLRVIFLVAGQGLKEWLKNAKAAEWD